MSESLEQIRESLIEEVKSLTKSALEDSMMVTGRLDILRKYIDVAVERALNKFDYETRHYMKVGKAAEEFFGAMSAKGFGSEDATPSEH